MRSQRHSDCSDQYSVLGDLEHPPASLEDSKKGGVDEEELLRRRSIGGTEDEESGEGNRWRRTEGGNGRMEGGHGQVEGGNGRVEGGKGVSSDLDFVIDVTQTEPKSMSLQVTLSRF